MLEEEKDRVKLELELSKEELLQLDDALTFAYEEKYKHIPEEKISDIINKVHEKLKEVMF